MSNIERLNKIKPQKMERIEELIIVDESGIEQHLRVKLDKPC